VVEALPPLLPPRGVRILCSPYLRCIQTATPTSQALGVPISLEEGLAECHFSQGYLPTVQQRWAYFPHLDLPYTRLYMPRANDDVHPQAGVGECESFPDGYFRRMLRFAPIFTDFIDACNDGDVVILFSHAASVALVASLLGEDDVPWRMAPCGIFTLERNRESRMWSLIGEHGGENAHVSSRSPGTFPWGFNEERRAKWMPIKREIQKEEKHKKDLPCPQVLVRVNLVVPLVLGTANRAVE
jgi:transcription factor C subunit 7